MRSTESLVFLVILALSLPGSASAQSTKQKQSSRGQSQAQSNWKTSSDDDTMLLSNPDGKTVRVPRHPVSTNHSPNKLELPEPDLSLWYRYFKAGEDASLTHHDQELAKKYFFAALSQIEKSPPSRSDMFLSVKLSALEQYLTEMYPKDSSNQSVKTDDQMKLKEEQVNTLYRIARVNEKIGVPRTDLLYSKSQERYLAARKELESAKQAAQKQKAAEGNTTNKE